MDQELKRETSYVKEINTTACIGIWQGALLNRFPSHNRLLAAKSGCGRTFFDPQITGWLNATLIQRVNFHDGDAGGVVHAAHDGGIGGIVRRERFD